MMARFDRDRGFVLVNALVIIAALSLVAVAVLRDARRGGDLVALARDAQQAELISEAGVVFAKDLLSKDVTSGPIDHLGEAWALEGYVAKANAGSVRITVRDLESRLNVNLLATDQADTALPVLERLVQLSGGEGDVAQMIAALMADREREEGAASFRRGDVTHFAALGDITGSSTEAFDALRSVVSALPGERTINVNTAEPGVLSALLGTEDNLIDGLVALRRRTPFEDAEAFASAVGAIAGQDTPVPTGIVGTSSHWFEIDTVARYGESELRARTIVVRNPETGEVRTFARQALGPGEAW